MHIDWNAFFSGLLLLVVGILGWINTRKGLTDAGKPGDTKKPPASHVELAGALVDSSSIKQVSIEISGLTSAVSDLMTAIVDGKEEHEEHRHALNRVREALDRLTMETARGR